MGEKVPNNVIEYKSGDGNDTIEGFNETSTLQIGGGKGSYSTQTRGDDIIIEVGEYKAPLNIVGTEGNDNIDNTLDGATIQALGGNDSISNSGNSVTINGGAGNDTISLTSDAENNLIQYKSGEGNDSIFGFNEDDTLSISGSYSTQESGADILIKVGKGTITLKNVHANTGTININGEEIKLEKNVTLTDGDDSFENTRNNAVINALGGDDTISNSVDEVTIDGGAGNDYIHIYGHDELLDQEDVIIAAEDYAENNTISGGSSYSSKKSGDNVIVTVGKGKITLEGATYLDTLNIVSDKPSWTLDGTTAKYGTNDNTLVTVEGVKSLDGISLKNEVVTVSKASLSTDNVTVSDGYTLKLGSDVTKPSTSKAAWKLNKTTATYSQTTTAGYTLSDNGKSVSYSKSTATALAGVKGAKSVKGLSVSGETITLKNSSLSNKVTISGAYEFDFASDYKQATITGSSNDDTITARGLKVSINGGNSDDTIKVFGSANTVTGGAGDDYLDGSANNDKLYGGKGDDILIGGAGNDSLWGDAGADNFIYSSGDGKDVIFGFDNNDTLTLDGLELTSGSYNKTKGELTLKVDGGSIMLKEFTATSFNVNDDTYKISGTKLIKK